MEEFDKLMKLTLLKLREIAKLEGVKFQENDTKSMLSSAIIAYRALNATKKIVKTASSAKVDKTKVEAAKKRLALQNESRKIAEAEAAKIKVEATPSLPEEKTPEGEKEVGETGYRYNNKSISIFDCWEKI